VKILLRLDICEGAERFHGAVVEVDRDLAAALLKRIELAGRLAEADSELDSLSYAPETSEAFLLSPTLFAALTKRSDTAVLDATDCVHQLNAPVPPDAVRPMSWLLQVCEFGASWRLGTSTTSCDTSFIPTGVLQRLVETEAEVEAEAEAKGKRPSPE
jgi:hypothetical protein